jgi:hypothetical protein
VLRRSATKGERQSFHNRPRDECLNQELFLSVAEARVVIEDWRRFYNRVHPHSRVGIQSPDDFSMSMVPPRPSPRNLTFQLAQKRCPDQRLATRSCNAATLNYSLPCPPHSPLFSPASFARIAFARVA